MASSKSWLKLWICWTRDPDIHRLSWADRGRWTSLFLLVGEHGDTGRWLLRNGVADLPEAWRRGRTSAQVCDDIGRLPGFVLTIDPLASPAITIEMPNWRKYQVDSSTDRTRRWRASSVTPTVTGDARPPTPGDDVREEKKRIEPPTPRFSPRRLGTNPRAQGTNPRSTDSLIDAIHAERDPARAQTLILRVANALPPAELLQLKQDYNNRFFNGKPVELPEEPPF